MARAILLAGGILLTAACAGGHSAPELASTISAQIDAAEQIDVAENLSIHSASFVDGGSAADFSLEWQTNAALATAVLSARPDKLPALVGSLRYDPLRLNPQGLQPSAAWSADSLEFLHDAEAGLLHFAMVQPRSVAPLKSDAPIELLRISFAREPFMQRTVSAAQSPPLDGAWRCYIEASEEDALRLYHSMEGDYDQNGEVNAADLVPLGRYLGESAPYAAERSHLRAVDGNRDGLLSIADIVPIGRRFGSRATAYRIYSSDSSADYPAVGLSSNGAGSELLDEVLISGMQIDPADGRLSWPLGQLDDFRIYWARPLFADIEGVASDRFGRPNLVSGFGLMELEFHLPGVALSGSIEDMNISLREEGSETVLELQGDALSARFISFILDFDSDKRRLTSVELNSDFIEQGVSLRRWYWGGADSVYFRIHHYQPGQTAGLTGSNLTLATLRFSPGASDGQLPQRDKLLPLAPQAGDPLLSFDSENMELRWLYNLPMDGYQNGEVNISSLSPIGVHVNQPAVDSSTVAFLIDGNEDGVVDFWDMLWVEYHFGRMHSGFKVYRSLSPEDYPADAAEAEQMEAYAAVDIGFSQNSERRKYSLTLTDEDRGYYYWLTGAGYLSGMLHVPELPAQP